MLPWFRRRFDRISLRCLLMAAFIQCIIAIIVSIFRVDTKRWISKIYKGNAGKKLVYASNCC
jgi:FtsH-binding integral membrane protein